MTREELRDYVDEQRTLNNIPYHVYSVLIDGIDTLEQEPILDEIRAEIIEMRSKQNVGVLECLDIIDKYKAESEKVNGRCRVSN